MVLENFLPHKISHGYVHYCTHSRLNTFLVPKKVSSKFRMFWANHMILNVKIVKMKQNALSLTLTHMVLINFCTQFFLMESAAYSLSSPAMPSFCDILIKSHMSHYMEKPTIWICENKGADQLRSHCVADQRLCFRYTDSAIPLLLKSEISSF